MDVHPLSRPRNVRKARATLRVFVPLLFALNGLLLCAYHLALDIDHRAGRHFPEVVRADAQVKRMVQKPRPRIALVA